MEHEAAEKAIFEERRELGKESFWYFISEILFPRNFEEEKQTGKPTGWALYYTDGLHKDLAMELDLLEKGDDFWAFLPREFRKSFVIQILHTIHTIVKYPDSRQLLVGAREETVKPFARLIRSAFTPGASGWGDFQKLYYDYMLDSRSKLRQAFQFTIPIRKKTLPDPTFRATYLGVSGAGWRTDILRCDDVVERRNVTSPEMSLQTTTKLLDLMPLIDRTSDHQNVIGTGTRWAYHDPYGRIIGEETMDTAGSEHIRRIQDNPKMKVMIRHCLEHPTELCTICPPHIVASYPHNRPMFSRSAIHPIDPIHTVQTVYDTFDRYLASPELGESLFWHQHMNVCLAPGDQKFKTQWFNSIDTPDWPAPRRRAIVLDTADKELVEEGDDYMVALFVSYDHEGYVCFRHGLRSKDWSRDEFIEAIVAYCQATRWFPQFVGKEPYGANATAAQLIKRLRECGRPAVYIPCTRAGGEKGKFQYIVDQAQQPWEQGEAVFGSTFPLDLKARMVYEYTNLSQTSYDDVADCASNAFHPKLRGEAHRKSYKPTRRRAPSMGNYMTPADAARQRARGMRARGEPTIPGLDTAGMEAELGQRVTVVGETPPPQGLPGTHFLDKGTGK